jgi:hypothetical protein
LIHVSKPDHYALYDLATDPLEQVDVSNEHPDVMAGLVATLTQRYDEHAAHEPAPENRVELDDGELERLRALGYVP